MSIFKKFRQPSGVYTIAMIDIWERFSFTGMRSCFILYLIKQLLYSKTDASYLYGWFGALAYFAPCIGGYITDRWLSLRKAIAIGSWSRLIGLLMLSSGIKELLIPSMMFIIIATGLMRAGMYPMVGLVYNQKDNDAQRDAGYRIFFISARIGGFLSILICGYVAEKYGYNYTFFISSIGILIGQIVYFLTAKKTLGDIGTIPIRKKEQDKSHLTTIEKRKLLTLGFMLLFVSCYDICEEQIGIGMTLLVDSEIDKTILEWKIPTIWFQIINPCVIIFGTPLFGVYCRKLQQKGKEPSYNAKFAISLYMMFIAYAVMIAISYALKNGINVSVILVMISVLCQTIGEIYMMPALNSLICKLSPKRYLSTTYGIVSLELCLSIFISSRFGGLYQKMEGIIFFSIFMIISLFFAILATICNKRIKRNIDMKE